MYIYMLYTCTYNNLSMHVGAWLYPLFGQLFPGTHGHLLRTVIRFTLQLVLSPGWSY